MRYETLFQRNSGVMTEAQQQVLKDCRILIIGTGGIGGIGANCFARTGVGHFILSDFDSFEASNMNRQVFCTTETLGMNKAEVTEQALRAINPSVTVECIPRIMSFEEIEQKLEDCDFVFPAADDFAFSLTVFRMASERSVPALIVVPSGLWARTAVIPPGGMAVEHLFGLPLFKETSYELLYGKLKQFMTPDMYAKAGRFYLKSGGWRESYFNQFLNSEKSPTQICPLVWLSTTAGVFEAIKYLTAKGKAHLYPAYLEISGSKLGQYHLRRPSFSSLRTLFMKIILKRRLKSMLKRGDRL